MNGSVRVTTHHADGTTETTRFRSPTADPRADHSDETGPEIEAFAAVPRPFWAPDDDRFAWLRNRRVQGAALLAVATVLGLIWALRAPSASESEAGPSSNPTNRPPMSTGPTTTVVSQLTVHVAGAVARPGVVRLRPGARVMDALDATGGAQPEADLTRLNLAAPLADGVQILVTRAGEAQAPAAGPGTRPLGAGDARVNINTASAAELDALPGIGPSRATAIIREREEHGPFASVDDLHRVKGLGASRIDELRDRVST